MMKETVQPSRPKIAPDAPMLSGGAPWPRDQIGRERPAATHQKLNRACGDEQCDHVAEEMTGSYMQKDRW